MTRPLCLLTLFGAMLLSACASTLIPTPAHEAVPATWAHGDSSPVPRANTSEPVQAWWKSLGDPQLDQLIDQALAANADVRVLVARLRRAHAGADLAGAARRPKLDASAPDGQGGSVTTPAYRQSRLGVQIEGSYELDLLGRLALSEYSALAERAASAADLRALRQWLALEVVQAYAELRLADDRLANAQATGALVGQLLQAEHRRLQAGLINRNDLRVVERQHAEKLDEQADLQRQRSAAAIRLAGLLGRAPVELSLAPRAPWLAMIELSGAMAPDLPASVIERRADVAAAWQRVAVAQLEAQSAQLERYPSFSLTGSTGFVSSALRRWLRGDALIWVAQAALQAPLLDGGRNRAKTDQAIATLEERQAEHRKLVLQALSEVETALNAAAVAQQRVNLARAESQRRATDRASAQAALAAGAGSRSNLLQAEVAERMVSETTLARRHELLLAWASAQRALGQ